MMEIFNYFVSKVLKDCYTANEQVYIFLYICENCNNIIKKFNSTNSIDINNRVIEINVEEFNNFISKYEEIKDIQIKDLNVDSLIQANNRRMKGEFYTPSVLVNEVHNIINEKLGQDWKDKYVVWDCAWGTGHLTKGHKFKELYCSTLNETDLLLSKKYNKEAIKFQYDFLNDSIDNIPERLIQAFKNDKPILFLINPPYGTASNNRGSNDGKVNIANTKMNELMKKYKIGACSQQLYAQFLYRILLFKTIFNCSNINIAIISPTLFLSGSSYKQLRQIFFNSFSFEYGMVVESSIFNDLNKNWSIGFSLWTNSNKNITNDFPFEVKKYINNKGFQIIKNKYIYNADTEKNPFDYLTTELDLSNREQIENPYKLKNALSISNSKTNNKWYKHQLGYLVNDQNSVLASQRGVILFSGVANVGHYQSIPIFKDNLINCLSWFSARRIIKYEWHNERNEFLVPNTDIPLYKDWLNDVLIYSIFNNQSLQSAMSGIEGIDLKNELFFMSKEEIMPLCLLYKEPFENCCNSKERYLYTLIQNSKLSKEASDVLEYAKYLVALTFENRKDYIKYHLNCWDAGWYQIKIILKELYPNELQHFNELYSKLEEKMLPMVYELGFMK